MVIHKLTVSNSTGGRTPAPLNTHMAIRDFLVSLGGIRAVQSVASPFYESYNLTDSNEEQLASYLSSSSYSFGAIIDGHETNMRPDTFIYLTGSNGLNARSSVTVYFFVDNNKIVGLKPDLDGWVFFYRDDDGLRVSFQGARTNNTYSRDLTNKIQGGTAQWCGTINLAGQYLFDGYAQSVPFYTLAKTPLPTGKIIRYPTIENDIRFGVCRYRDYPVSMYDADVAYTPQVKDASSTTVTERYKKIQIDGQNYMHVGGLAWVQYDSIVEHNINV